VGRLRKVRFCVRNWRQQVFEDGCGPVVVGVSVGDEKGDAFAGSSGALPHRVEVEAIVAIVPDDRFELRRELVEGAREAVAGPLGSHEPC
jgi:hypothetical protein